nr:hypothetical protein CFP56_37328 [Quercus suber]
MPERSSSSSSKKKSSRGAERAPPAPRQTKKKVHFAPLPARATKRSWGSGGSSGERKGESAARSSGGDRAARSHGAATTTRWPGDSGADAATYGSSGRDRLGYDAGARARGSYARLYARDEEEATAAAAGERRRGIRGYGFHVVEEGRRGDDDADARWREFERAGGSWYEYEIQRRTEIGLVCEEPKEKPQGLRVRTVARHICLESNSGRRRTCRAAGGRGAWSWSQLVQEILRTWDQKNRNVKVLKMSVGEIVPTVVVLDDHCGITPAADPLQK